MTDAQSAQTALDKLIEAVEAGIYDGTPKRAARFNDFSEAWEAARGAYTQPGYKTAWNAYQGSLDAALALHEALLPGWAHLVRSSIHGDGYRYRVSSFFSNVWRDDECPNNGAQCFDTWAPTPARAWLLAILRAYRSMQP